MDGVHNLGGKQGFGPVRYKTINHVFRAAWEPRAIAVYSMGLRPRLINRDKYRDTIERMEPRHYLSVSYYERLRAGFVTLCVEKGIVTREDLKKLAGGASPLSLPSAEGRHNAVPRESFEKRYTSKTSSSPAMCTCRVTSAVKSVSSSAFRRSTPARTRPHTIFRRRTNPPTTSASGPRIYCCKPP